MQLKFKHFIFLQILDVLTTWYAITYLNIIEANPFANNLFENYGLIIALICMKSIALMIIYGLIYVMPLNNKKLAINIICFMYFFVIANNIYQISIILF